MVTVEADKLSPCIVPFNETFGSRALLLSVNQLRVRSCSRTRWLLAASNMITRPPECSANEVVPGVMRQARSMSPGLAALRLRSPEPVSPAIVPDAVMGCAVLPAATLPVEPEIEPVPAEIEPVACPGEVAVFAVCPAVPVWPDPVVPLLSPEPVEPELSPAPVVPDAVPEPVLAVDEVLDGVVVPAAPDDVVVLLLEAVPLEPGVAVVPLVVPAPDGVVVEDSRVRVPVAVEPRYCASPGSPSRPLVRC